MVDMSQSSVELKALDNTDQILIWKPNGSAEPYLLNEWTPPLREQILKSFWNVNIEGHHDVTNQRHEPEIAHRYDPFFTNFEIECQDLNLVIQEREGHWACKRYGQLFGLLEFLRRNQTKKRRDCLTYFDKNEYAGYSERDKCDMIDLVILLWLRVDVTRERQPGQGPCVKQVWDDATSLATIVRRQFPERPVPNYTSRKPNWTRYLRAYSLTNCQYFRIRWTNRLEDHLFLDPYQEPPEIWIFHWATFLEDFSNPYSPDFKLFPEGLLRETSDTLALLIPYLDSRSSSWFKKETNTTTNDQGKKLLDQRAAQQPIPVGVNLVSHYKYWGERLDIIQTAYDEAEPVSFFQWRKDDRRNVKSYEKWLTFLGVAFALGLGFINLILSILQVYGTLKPSK
ncbi:hypothetical protein N431DRAFT_413052 [Stipitochalara longipes BDJ]|nr:hypothetical protein N431DRAFT_413052 [Stipitochalara longipes BDJ]